MALVIMCLPRRHPRAQWQNRLSPVELLDLALLIHTQNHRSFWRVEIQPDDVPNLLNELRIFG